MLVCTLDVRRDESYALIDRLSEQESVELVCIAFEVPRSCYYEYRKKHSGDVPRMQLRVKVIELFECSRSLAENRTIVALLCEQGIPIGCFKVRRLMREVGVACKQPGPHKNKRAMVEDLDISKIDLSTGSSYKSGRKLNLLLRNS